MLIADTYLGSLADEEIAARTERDETHRVVLDDTDRQRSRVRTTTVDGVDLGLTVSRELQDEDVLVARDRENDDTEHLIVVELERIPAISLSFDETSKGWLPAAVELGHAIGNRHRELVLGDGKVLIRAEQDRERLDALLDTRLPDDVTVVQTTVEPGAFDSDTGPGRAHSHTHPDADHSHDHSTHSHSHTHSDAGHSHNQTEVDEP